MKTSSFLFLLVFLTGCASRIPRAISEAPAPNPTLAEVLAQPSVQKQPVRWGGTILAVTNHANDTEIEILAKALERCGKPRDGDETQGRFLARVDGFLDPAVYAHGRLLTVYGPIDSVLTRDIGEKPYLYPLIRIQSHYLWPQETEYVYPAYYPYGYYWPSGYYSFGYRRRW